MHLDTLTPEQQQAVKWVLEQCGVKSLVESDIGYTAVIIYDKLLRLMIEQQ